MTPLIEEESSRLETRRTSDQTLQIPSFLFLFFSPSFSLLFPSFLFLSFSYDCTVGGLCSRGCRTIRVFEGRRGISPKETRVNSKTWYPTWPTTKINLATLWTTHLDGSSFERFRAPLKRPALCTPGKPAILPAHRLYVDENDCIGKLNTGHRNYSVKWYGRSILDSENAQFLQAFHRKSSLNVSLRKR